MSNDDPHIDELLDQWEDSLDDGRELSADELCKSCPELVALLRDKIAALKKVNSCLDAHENEPSKSNFNPRELESVQFDAKLVDLRFHDRGGLGVVYKAHDHQLHREVAVKFLNKAIAKNDEECKRFRQEAEITGRLDHPGVVPVYANGKSNDDQPFYVMRFIRGDTYDDAIKQFHKSKSELNQSEQRVALQKLLGQLISVCQTVGYAHTRGIVHRDIKPKNIMLGKYGETMVVDWGLAIPFDRAGQFRVKDEKTLVPKSIEDSGSGREGEGTPVFMSPEQAAGKDDLGPASDIYSLGVVLYRALTGKFAYDGDSPMEIKTAIMNGNFLPPRKVERKIPPALEAICLKAMQLDIKQRYATALEMADELENFLADAPVSSYQYSTFEKVRRYVRRNQSLFTTLFTSALVLAVASMLIATRQYKMQRQTLKSLNVAKQSQLDSLNMTCLMTARSIQYNLESRLIALEDLASSDEMVALMKAVDEPGKKDRLLELLKDSRDALQIRLPSVSWFLLDNDGNLVCRVSDDDTIEPGKKIWQWTRPYFHGGDEQLPSSKNPDDVPPPLKNPVLSPVFFGKYQDRELCSMSVPVKGEQADGHISTVGVLVATMQMGQFEPLIQADSKTTKSKQRFASLVETRGELKGALLHHPKLVGLSSVEIKQKQVCESVFAKLSEIDCSQISPQSIEGYVDPFEGDFAGVWNSVALPIQIRSRDKSTVSCGWYLMVQDRPIVND